MPPKSLLEVKELKTWFRRNGKTVRAVDGVSFSLEKGETLGIVGESGCGKTITSLSIMGLLPEGIGEIVGGEILFNGRNIARLSDNEMCQIRGKNISMIFQEPMTSLNPVFKCGDQIAEAITTHLRTSPSEAMNKTIELLRLVEIPEPEKRALDYPHQLSGGMRQRVMIAMALSCSPQILIADEPTTALDVTIQAQILDLMGKLKKELGMSIIMITHDLGVIAKTADKVIVMYAGKVVEEAPVHALFENPLHPYTLGLLGSIPNIEKKSPRLTAIPGVVPNPEAMIPGCRFSPRCDFAATKCFEEEPELKSLENGRKCACFMTYEKESFFERKKDFAGMPIKKWERSDTPLLQVNGVKKYYAIRRGFFRKTTGHVKAVDDVSFCVYQGETLGLVGESGCGKTTLGKMILRLLSPTSGQIVFDGNDLTKMSGEPLRKITKHIQVVFQDPFASLNPRLTMEQTITEPLVVHNVARGAELKAQAKRLIEAVGLSEFHLKRYPHEFSGGQRQRIGIARALALNPKLIVCDEPVASLDVSIQSQILNLLKDLQDEYGMSYIFISHSLSAVKHISERVGVMYLGKLVELIDSESLSASSRHPYTRALMSAIPIPDPNKRANTRILLEGDVPSPVNPPSGCRFHTRCHYVKDICKDTEPALVDLGEGHLLACHCGGSIDFEQ